MSPSPTTGSTTPARQNTGASEVDTNPDVGCACADELRELIDVLRSAVPAQPSDHAQRRTVADMATALWDRVVHPYVAPEVLDIKKEGDEPVPVGDELRLNGVGPLDDVVAISISGTSFIDIVNDPRGKTLQVRVDRPFPAGRVAVHRRNGDVAISRSNVSCRPASVALAT